jgi:hypothetical protein
LLTCGIVRSASERNLLLLSTTSLPLPPPGAAPLFEPGGPASHLINQEDHHV